MTTQETIHGLFEEHAQRKPNDIAVLNGKYSLSYNELNTRANQLAHYLLSMRIQPDTPIAFCMERSFECLITILGILKARAAYLPLDPDFPKERLSLILNNSNTPLLITQNYLKKQCDHYQGTILYLDDTSIHLEKQPTTNPLCTKDPQQLAYIIYTSGSTGVPKGVQIEHHSVVDYTRWFGDYASVKAKQRIDFASNHTFDMAVTTSITPLMLGLTVVICDKDTKKNLNHYLSHLKSSKINIIKTTPSFFKALLEEVNNKFIALPYLKTIILGGEALSAMECKAWLKLYPKHTLHNEYGPTEATVAVCQYTITADTLNKLPINVPIGTKGYHIDFRILNSNNHPVADQEAGELYIGGSSCLARGYLNQPEMADTQFVQLPDGAGSYSRFYKTGDLCVLRHDGLLEYLGRRDSQVKIRGFRIEPVEIEKHLIKHPAIQGAVAVSKKDSFNENRLLAYYILKPHVSTLSSGDLREYLQQWIPDFMIPSTYIQVHSFPLTANGKLDASLLPEPELKATQIYRQPVTRIEKTLTAIWSKELGIECIGLDDNFYELGGHSLSAARIVSKINAMMGTQLILKDFYSAMSIAALSTIIAHAKKRRRMPFNTPFSKRAGVCSRSSGALIEPLPEKNQHIATPQTNIPLSDFQFMLWIANTFESKAKKLNITARKRFQGTLDKHALELAFNAVLKKQEIFLYRILQLKPAQQVQQDLSFKMIEADLSTLSVQQRELMLKESMDQLINYYPWPKNSPLISAKLFHLTSNEMELQISIPHIVSDDFSPDIVLSNVSKLYLAYKQQSDDALYLNTKMLHSNTYKHYVLNEQHDIQQYLDRDMDFWEQYMNDAGLLMVPTIEVVKNMQDLQQPYSTYTAIPQSTLDPFKRYCAKSHMSLTEGLCAALSLALCRYTYIEPQSPYIYMNIIKSTRNTDAYDDIVGCFLRLEPIKIALSSEETLRSLAQQIHHSSMETNLYQQCPDLIKLSAISTFRQKKQKMKQFILNVLITLYAVVFSLPEVNKKIFKRCSERIASFKKTNHFLVNINVQKSFMDSKESSPPNLFGLNTKNIESYQYDLLKINNVLDVCFIRDENNTIPYIVLSANLKSKYKEDIAKEVLNIMENAPLSLEKSTEQTLT